jgi:phosphoglycerate dehydrogenase-like enzyme
MVPAQVGRALRVAILDDYQNVALTIADWSAVRQQAAVTAFADHLSDEDQIVARLAGFDVVVAMRERTPFKRSLLERLPDLKLLITTGMRNNSFDLTAATELGIQVCGTDLVASSTVELTWALILAVARDIPGEDRRTREGQWQQFLPLNLAGSTLGVVGLGRLGSQVALIGHAFGMAVLAWSPSLTE